LRFSHHTTPAARAWCGDKFREGMEGVLQQIKKVFPRFPDYTHLDDGRYEGIDKAIDIFGDRITWQTPFGWVFYDARATNNADQKRHVVVLRLLINAGADPNVPCLSVNDGIVTHTWAPLEMCHNNKEARLLLEAGALISLCKRLDWLRWDLHESALTAEFYQASLRATAVVWCLEALRGTSTWPDTSFLLTKIIMDVSK
jgi:hypothetical protein